VPANTVQWDTGALPATTNASTYTGAFSAGVLANAPTGGSTNASTYTGVFNSAVLANAPTGSTVTYTLATSTVLGAIEPLPIEVQRYSSWDVGIAVETSQTGKAHAMVITSLSDPSTAVYTLGNSHFSVSNDGLTVQATDNDAFTSNAGAWYYYLQNTTNDARIAEGTWTVVDGPNITNTA
jgi:hypothetical protein